MTRSVEHLWNWHLALENPLELEVRFPRPRGMSSYIGGCATSVGNCDDDSAMPDCVVRAGLNLSRKDRLPDEVWLLFCWQLREGAPYLEPDADTLGPGSPEVRPRRPSFVASFLAGDKFMLLLIPEAVGIERQGDGGTEGIRGVPPLSCMPYCS